MRKNTLKQKLNEGKAVFGTMITFPSATMVEMLGCLGYDWILIDNERKDDGHLRIARLRPDSALPQF